MLRVLLTIVLPIALPLLLYIGYVNLTRRRAQAAGEEGLPRWQEGPWPWFVLAGVALMFSILVAVQLTTGVPPGTKLESPRLIDGEIVPSHVAE